MSSRVLRKLQGRDNELKNLAALAASSSEDEDHVTNESQVAPRNKFSLLTESGSDEVENIDEQQPEDKSNAEVKQEPQLQNGAKRKKRSKKKKKNHVENHNVEYEDIEKVAKEVEQIAARGPTENEQSHKQTAKKLKYVLSVEHRLLNPDNELRRIFGARTLLSDANYRHRNQAKVTRGTWLTAPTPSWPRMSKTGLSMVRFENSKKYQYFTYEHNKEYQETQFKFLDAVDSSDHNLIALVLKDCNYHVDCLLTLSDVCRVNDDSQMARELLERALYSLERNFHSQFNLTTGTCRLPYKRPENRCLFLALYRHLHFVFQRGCGRTALELCKVLLNLDPDEDPLCVLLFIDFFALQAAEYKFLIQLFTEWEIHKNLSQLPNFSFSLAMAHFELAQLEDKDYAMADKLLQAALIKFPSVLMMLLEKCSVQPDKKVTDHQFFTTEATLSSPDGLQLICNLFVARNHSLWKSAEVMPWLERNVNAVLERVDTKDPEVAKCRQKRKKYQKPPLNIYRYAMISELPGVISLLPPEIRLGQVLSHDPLPPPDTIVSYTRPERSRPRRSDNPLGLFFQSLLPQFDPAHVEAEGAAGGQDADQVGVRERVQILMEAMRDMLGNVQIGDNEEDVPDFNEDEWD